MGPRLPEIPGLKSTRSQVQAGHYNRARVALARLGSPLQLMLPGRRGFAFLLDRRAWVCVDRGFDNAPIIAWTDFEPGARRSLTAPVPCRVVFYHPYASVLVRTLLDDAERILGQRLQRQRRPGQGQVVPFAAGRR